MTGPEDQDPEQQSIGPNDNAQILEGQEHVDQIQDDKDVDQTQEDQDQKES